MLGGIRISCTLARWAGLALLAAPAYPRERTTVFYFSATPEVFADADADALPDDWELRNGLDPLDPTDAAGDLDGDGLTALAEHAAGTDPWQLDSDANGIADGQSAAPGPRVSVETQDHDNQSRLTLHQPAP